MNSWSKQSYFLLKTMLRLLEDLPVELVGTNVFSYLSLKDVVMLERACGSEKSHQAFMEQIPHRPPVVLPFWKYTNISTLNWFAKSKFRIQSLTVRLPGNNPGLHVKNLQVDYFELFIDSYTTIECLKPLLESNVGYKVRTLEIVGDQNKEVVEQLSACTSNVKQLTIRNSNNCMDWLTADILSRWKLKEISFDSAIHVELLLVLSKTELTSIKLLSNNIDDAAVIAIAQHCPKLETLLLESRNITWTSLVALSERGLSLKELDIASIPNIPAVDIARRCSHALSCIRNIDINNLHQNGPDASILIPYMTGLTSVRLRYYNCRTSILLLTQHCHKLTIIDVYGNGYPESDILSLCRANPLLEKIYCHCRCDFTDTTLIELIHACPHLHTLYLPNETNITDIGILALSEHCPQQQLLAINKCHKVTEVAVLQLLQRCRKLTRLGVSSSTVSEETWTQLDKNTQKRVRRL